MQTYETTRNTRSDLSAAQAEPAASLGRTLYRSVRSHPAYERAALATAFDDGLMPDEVARILAGRRVAEAFPVRRGESPEDYASRAVAEMFVAYLQ
ncbi:hypothetical protein MKK69_23355 [Methylobacterium sp. J-026]|uniref:hypothetical protein n=1 Tax=Methylobacterium sp. J-026 TaxID=2836624 RepID=UPI001FBABDAE|nr:hypothetical protein [Methylobacterium sp. J-026]MCJ2136950.1 hypothetical protein [Methylobacterium sp. J-026]